MPPLSRYTPFTPALANVVWRHKQAMKCVPRRRCHLLGERISSLAPCQSGTFVVHGLKGVEHFNGSQPVLGLPATLLNPVVKTTYDPPATLYPLHPGDDSVSRRERGDILLDERL
jgi:hypothetical protein